MGLYQDYRRYVCSCEKSVIHLTKIESMTRIVKGRARGFYPTVGEASKKLQGFEDLNGKGREEPAFATIPIVSA